MMLSDTGTLTHARPHRAGGAGCQISCNELRRHLSHSCSGVYSSSATFCSSSYLPPLTSITLNHWAPRCLPRPRPLLFFHLLASTSSPSPSSLFICALLTEAASPPSHSPPTGQIQKRGRRVSLRTKCEMGQPLTHPPTRTKVF